MYGVIRWRAALPWRRALRQTGWGWGQPDYGDGYYGPYGWGGRVPGGYYGVYPYPYVTGQPTLVPQYYSGNYGAYPYGGYPSGYYGRPTLFPRYYGW